MCRHMSFEIILISKTSTTNFTFMADPHMPVLVMIPVLSNSVKSFITILTPMSKLVQVSQHVLLNILFIHESSEAEVANRSVCMLGDVVQVEFAIFGEGCITNIAVVDKAFTLFDMSEEHELIYKQLLASQAFVVGDFDLAGGVHINIVRSRKIWYLVPSFRLWRSRFGLGENPFARGGFGR